MNQTANLENVVNSVVKEAVEEFCRQDSSQGDSSSLAMLVQAHFGGVTQKNNSS